MCLDLNLLPVPDGDGSAVTGLVAALLLMLIGVGVILLVLRKRRNNGKNEQPVCQTIKQKHLTYPLCVCVSLHACRNTADEF